MASCTCPMLIGSRGLLLILLPETWQFILKLMLLVPSSWMQAIFIFDLIIHATCVCMHHETLAFI